MRIMEPGRIVKKKPKAKTITLPLLGAPKVVIPPKQKVTPRPAPKSQPGPYTNTQRKVVAKAKTQAPFKKAVKAAHDRGTIDQAVKVAHTPALIGSARTDPTIKPVPRDVQERAKFVKQLSPAERRKFYGTADVNTAAVKSVRRDATKRATNMAPAVKVLDYASRPGRAISSTVDAVTSGKDPLKAAGRAVLHGKGPMYGDILRKHGVPNGIAAVVGTGADVVGDPTTYLTFGTASVARKVAEHEARVATEKALAKGAVKAEADRAGRAAAAKSLADSRTHAKGLQVGAMGGIPRIPKVPLTGKRFSVKAPPVRAPRPVSKVATRLRESNAVQKAGTEFVHDFRPMGVSPAQHAARRAAERELRAGQAQASKRAYRLKKRLTKQGADEAVLHHIESGAPLSALGAKAPVARDVQKVLGDAYNLKHSRGITVGKFAAQGPTDAQRYIPHQWTPERKFALKAKPVGRGTTKAAKDLGRTIREPAAVQNLHTSGLVDTNLPRVVASHVEKAGQKAALADFWQKVARTGKRLTPHTRIAPGEMVFELSPQGMTPLLKKGTNSLDFAKVSDALNSGKPHIVMSHADYENVVARMNPGQSKSAPGRFYDRAQGVWKTVVTVPMPSYHLRNLMGDSMNAWLGDTTTHAASQSVKVLNYRRARNRMEMGGKAAPTPGAVQIRGKAVPYDKLLKDAENAGVIDQGFIGRELADLKHKEPGRFTRALQYREDTPRLATYIAALQRGMTKTEAAAWSLKHHFDYGDLTPTERQLRRAFPFYTFWARNSRLWATKVVQRPGKMATLGKILNESATAAGFKDYNEYAGQLRDYQQRGLPIPLRFGGKTYDTYFAPPATDLNQLTADPKAQLQNTVNRVTAAKALIELYLNKSAFFQSDIQNKSYPLVPAPAFVKVLPDAIKHAMGITQYEDKKVGKVWGWPGKLDYAFRQLPESNLATQVATPVEGSRGQTASLAVQSVATGVRRVPHEQTALGTQLGTLQQQLGKLNAKAGLMIQKGKLPGGSMGADGFQTAEYARVRKQIRDTQVQITKLKKQRGDNVEPRKAKVRKKPGGAGGMGGGLGGGMGGGLGNGGF